ncbi:BCCT family transporter [Pseudomonas lalucatii]|uniref:BCCT family transporter n=1 Tax=Pseudomonas lalucatii TaxID=1424203 RepID=A0ABS5PYE2_9PSED|nr:BCCT family transporter [Pseudomonas lalucatii]MBS7661496.1 BCCT family transporter [Pseudomonas lalucatii]MBS7724048.1 BCCT family transporter [Pseudomonas lalucatii]
MRDMVAEGSAPEDFNIRLMGLNFHRIIFPTSLLVVLALVLSALNDPTAFGQALEGVKGWILSNCDWFIMITGNLAVLFCAGLALSPFGKIRLGGRDAKPEFGLLSWFSMLFAAGMGVGLLYWGVAEPVAQYTEWWKTPLNVPKQTPEALHAAMGSTIFHWGFHPWAIYLTSALVVGFFAYNKGLPFSLSSGLQPLIGKAHKGLVGQMVDSFTVVLTVFGLATSLGLGAMQATAGISHVLGLPNTFALQLLFILLVTGLAGFSLWRGMDAGVKLLSNINMLLALGLFVLVVAGVGALAFFSGVLDTTLDFATFFLPLSNWVDRPDRDWFQGWTVFYWAWWCTWGPLVGVFVARVSRGRTLRQMVGVVMVVPTLVAILWFSAFGGGAIAQVIDGTGALAAGLTDVNMAIFQFLEGLPLAGIGSVLVVILLIIFMVTSMDSGALVVDNLAAGGDPDTAPVQRVLWLVMIALVTITLFVVGGDTALKGIQAGAVAMGLPFMALMLLLMLGLLKALAKEPRH